MEYPLWKYWQINWLRFKIKALLKLNVDITYKNGTT